MPFQIQVQMSAKLEDPIVFHVPGPFPYTYNNYIPWNYTAITYVGKKPLVLEPTITNIAGVGGMTQSGRIFAPEQPLKKNTLKSLKGKEFVEFGKDLPRRLCPEKKLKSS